MTIRDPRRDYNGWRGLWKNYGLLVAIFLAGAGWGDLKGDLVAAANAAEDNKKEIADVKALQSAVTELLRQQAETNGRVAVALDTLTVQNQAIQRRLWEIKKVVDK